MPFQKGNTLGKAGRTPSIKTQVKDFIKEHPYAVETLMTVLYEAGIKGDRESAIYVIDRIKGKPKVTMGMDEEDRGLLKTATVVEFLKLVRKETLQLREGYNAIQREGLNSKGADEAVTGEEEGRNG